MKIGPFLVAWSWSQDWWWEPPGLAPALGFASIGYAHVVFGSACMDLWAGPWWVTVWWFRPGTPQTT